MYEQVDVFQIDFMNIVVIVVGIDFVEKVLKIVERIGFVILFFVVVEFDQEVLLLVLLSVSGVIQFWYGGCYYYGWQIFVVVDIYSENLLLLFFKVMCEYVQCGYVEFDCLGYQGGQFFLNYLFGWMFFDFFGEMLFCVDFCNVDVWFGDLLIYEGFVLEVQCNVVCIYNVDKIYFVLNGMLMLNKVVMSVLFVFDDFVLFDCNNYKLVYFGVFVLFGVWLVYFEIVCNVWGFIGGVDSVVFGEVCICDVICDVVFECVDLLCLFWFVVIQLGIYDGMIYNVCEIVDWIGYLCDYILFDLVWVGYEQFILMMQDCLLLMLMFGFDDFGIFVM